MNAPLLIELGCEELPARALIDQVELLAGGLERELTESGLVESAQTVRFATPRRLAVRIAGVRARQPDRKLQRKGPPEAAAFDADGKPTPAALGFARSVGLEVDQLDRLDNEQGRWLYAEIEQPGQPLAALLEAMLGRIVAAMAGARSMRWSDRDDRFLRPVRWLLALHGSEVVPLELFGLQAGRVTRGHRIHAPGPHELAHADDYEALLERAFVLADPERRRSRIVEQVDRLAAEAGLQTRDDPALVDEVSGLVEWPVAVIGRFEPEFLEVPAEALISSMREHQKSFPLFDSDALAARFISVANLESRDPEQMVHGFERVIRPRLADARFFYQQDRQRALADRFEQLEQMLFQERLGSLADKCIRIERIAARIASWFGAEDAACRRAARLCKCDLLTEMVGEFPELQGTMGRYYAAADGEPANVAVAIESHYLPRHAGDALPADATGRALAVADRLDTLIGIFAAGKKPKGGKDPFALRRAALAVVRILEAARCPATLSELLAVGSGVVGERLDVTPELREEIAGFIDDRLHAHLLERGIDANTLHAVSAVDAGTVAGYIDRAEAVQAFADDPAMTSLIAANKRAMNLLEQCGEIDFGDVDRNSMEIDAEADLFDAVVKLEADLDRAIEQADHRAALARLATLKPALDRFFDEVMVMVDDPPVRRNRLALLARTRALFLRVADVARLGRS